MLCENESMENDDASHHGNDSEPPVTKVFMRQACVVYLTSLVVPGRPSEDGRLPNCTLLQISYGSLWATSVIQVKGN